MNRKSGKTKEKTTKNIQHYIENYLIIELRTLAMVNDF